MTEKIHKGKWLKQVIDQNGLTGDETAALLSISRNYLYKMFRSEDLPFARLKKIADHLKIDLRDHFPESSHLYREERLEDRYTNLLVLYAEKDVELKEALSKIADLEHTIKNLPGHNRDTK